MLGQPPSAVQPGKARTQLSLSGCRYATDEGSYHHRRPHTLRGTPESRPVGTDTRLSEERRQGPDHIRENCRQIYQVPSFESEPVKRSPKAKDVWKPR